MQVKVGDLFATMVFSTIFFLFGDYMKRIFFIVKIYLDAKRKKVSDLYKLLDEDDSTIQDIMYYIQTNTDIKLKEDGMLRFPVWSYQHLWANDEPINQNIIERRDLFDRECEKILDKMPGCLLLPDRTEQINEVRRILTWIHNGSEECFHHGIG
jgi:hypothetical protein